MTTEQKIVQLKRWEAAYRALQKNYDAFCQLTGAGPEAPLFKPVWGMFERYTNSVAALVDDNNGWLDWYCWECGMGSSPMAAILGEDRLDVDSLDKLLLCIEHDGKEARNGRA
jgi:hypothetical protein